MANELHALALRDNRHLARFIIEGVPTGRQLGTGSYGSVEEVHIMLGTPIIILSF